MKNNELNLLAGVIVQMAEMRIVGAVKFKILKLLKEVENEMEPLRLAVQGLEESSEEYKEILDTEIHVEFKTFLTHADLEPLQLSAYQLLALEPVIKEEEQLDVANSPELL